MIAPRSCYVSPIDIPNIDSSEPNGNLSGNATKLDNFREGYERDVLIKCLGYPLYKELQDSLEVLENATEQTVKASADQKWKDLVNGKTYQIDGVNVIWDGLIFKEGVYNRSLIAQYVYYHFMDDNESQNTTTGRQSEKTKNSNKVSVAPSAVKAWRKFFEMTVGVYNTPIHYYEGGRLAGIDYFGSDNGQRSLYQFIDDMNTITPKTYDNWMPKLWENKSISGL